jgi:hypothetical protein
MCMTEMGSIAVKGDPLSHRPSRNWGEQKDDGEHYSLQGDK